MSLQAMHLVWKYSRHKGTKLLLMLAVADHCNDDFEAWPSQPHLAEKIRMSRGYTKDLIHALLGEKKPELVLIEAGQGEGHSSRYKILLSERREAPPSLPEKTQKGGRASQKGGRASQKGGRASQEGRAGPPLTVINPQEPSLTPNRQTAAAVDVWSMDALSHSAKLTKARREELEAAAPDPTGFVSRYLYALSHQGFRKPAMWAAAQLADPEQARQGEPGEPYGTLARLGPAGLIAVLAWLHNDVDYPFPSGLNGAGGAALAFRAHLTAKYAKQPAALTIALDDALSDLGLSLPAIIAEPAAPPEPAPERDPWQARCDELAAVFSAGPIRRLRSCRVVSSDADQTVIAADSKQEHDWLRVQLAARLANLGIFLQEVS